MKISFYCLTIYGEIINKNKIKNNNMINEHTRLCFHILAKRTSTRGLVFASSRDAVAGQSKDKFDYFECQRVICQRALCSS